MKSIVSVCAFVLLASFFLLPFDALGQSPNFWLGGGSTNLWDDPNSNGTNWHYGIAPINSFTDPQGGWDDPNFCLPPFGCYPLTDPNFDDGPNGNNNAMFNTEGTTTVIDSSVHAKAYGVRVGLDGASNTLMITGGKLDVGIDPNEPDDANAVGWHLDVGRGFNQSGNPNPKATVIMTGGKVRTNGLLIPEQFVDESVDPAPDPNNNYNTAPIYGEFLMSGGTMNARWMNVGQFVADGNAEISGTAVINLEGNVAGDPGNGGHLIMNRDWFINGQPVQATGTPSLDITDNAIINIFGSLNEFSSVPLAADVTRYESYVSNGWLTADNDTDDPTIYFDGSSVIKICALDADFDGDCDVDGDDLATWQSNYGLGPGATKADGDSDNDGFITGLDFLEWQIEYGVGVDSGAPLVGASTVPEPGSLLLFAGMSAALGLRRRR